MEIRDRQTRDAIADIAGLLATAYRRHLRARRIGMADETLPEVNGELDNPLPESLHVNEVDA